MLRTLELIELGPERFFKSRIEECESLVIFKPFIRFEYNCEKKNYVLIRSSLFVVSLLVATVQFEQERNWVLWI